MGSSETENIKLRKTKHFKWNYARFGMIFVFGWDWGNKYARYSISHEPLKQLSEKGEQKEEFWKTKKMFVQV